MNLRSRSVCGTAATCARPILFWCSAISLWVMGIMLVSPHMLYAQKGPGGDSYTNYLWFRADAGVKLDAQGKAVQQWESQAGGKTALPNNALKLPEYSSEEAGMNFNPTLKSSAGGGLTVDELNTAIANGGALFIVMKPNFNQDDDNAAPFSTLDNNLNKTGGIVEVIPGNFGSSSSLETKFYTKATGSDIYKTISVAGLLNIFGWGDFILKNTTTTSSGHASSEEFAPNARLLAVEYRNDAIGHWIDGKESRLGYSISSLLGSGKTPTISDLNLFAGNKNNLSVIPWNGMISEVLVFFDRITILQRKKIVSYLAAKYGITLSQSTPQDYIASDGKTVIWDGDRAQKTGKSYNVGIIGRDDNSGLHQVKSHSINPGTIFTCEALREGTNINPAFSKIKDLEFLSWSNDQKPLTEQSTGMPTGKGLLKRVQREWFVQEVGEIGAIEITANVDLIPASEFSIGNFKLLISNDGDFSKSDVQVISASAFSLASKTVTFSKVNLEDGQHFTLVTQCVPLIVQFDQSTASSLEKIGDNLPKIEISGGMSAQEYTVEVSLVNTTQTATAGADFKPNFSNSVKIKLPAGDYTQAKTIPIPGLAITNDNILEGDESFTLELKTFQGVSLGSRKTTTYTIIEDDGLSVTFEKPTGSILESDVNALPKLSVSGGISSIPYTVEVTLDNPAGNATPGTDLTPNFSSPISVTIPADDYTTAKKISIPGLAIVDDQNEEDQETINLKIANPSSGLSLGDKKTLSCTLVDNDGLTVYFDESKFAETESNGATLPKLKIRGGITAKSHTIQIALGSPAGDAAAGSDYTPDFSQPVTITIPADDYTTDKEISLSGIATKDDNIAEGDETIEWTLSSPNDEVNLSSPKRVSYTIVDNDGLVVEFTSSSYSSEEGNTTNLPKLSVSGGQISSNQQVEVILGAPVGRASAGKDYTPDFTLPLIVNIPADDYTTKKEIPLLGFSIVDDAEAELDEDISLTLQNPSANVHFGNTKTTSYTIIDNDKVSKVTLTLSTTEMSENNGSCTLTATLDELSSKTILVELAFVGTAPSNSYSYSANTLTIPAGSSSSSITLTGIDNNRFDGDRTIIASIVKASNALVSQSASKIITLKDDEPQPTVSLKSSASDLQENTGTITLTAELSNTSGQNVIVELTFAGTAPASSYSASAATLTIPAGSTSASVTLTGVDNNRFDGDRAILVSVYKAANALVSQNASTTITLQDNEQKPIVALKSSANNLQENTGKITLTTELSNPSNQDITVELNFGGTALPSNYSASASTLSLPAGSTSGSITLMGIDNNLFDGDRTIVVSIKSAQNADIQQTASSKSLILQENDPAPSLSLKTDAASLQENGGKVIITAELNTTSGQEVTVELLTEGNATGGVDYTLSNRTITIPAGKTSGSIEINGIDDQIDETNEIIILKIGYLTNATAQDPQSIQITIPGIKPQPKLSVRANEPTLLEDGGRTTLTFTLDQVSNTDVTFDLVSSGNSSPDDFMIPKTTFTIPAGQQNASVSITGVRDDQEENNEYAIFTLANVQYASVDPSASSVKLQFIDGKTIETQEQCSPNGDGINDLWVIKGIERYPKNSVRIFNRWGDLIYEVNGYDNLGKVFMGTANLNVIGSNELPDGTYFYVIHLGSGLRDLSGYISLYR